MELFPEDAVNFEDLSLVFAKTEQYEDAVNAALCSYELGGRRSFLDNYLAYIYALSGNRAEAKRRLKDIIEYSKGNF